MTNENPICLCGHHKVNHNEDAIEDTNLCWICYMSWSHGREKLERAQVYHHFRMDNLKYLEELSDNSSSL